MLTARTHAASVQCVGAVLTKRMHVIGQIQGGMDTVFGYRQLLVREEVLAGLLSACEVVSHTLKCQPSISTKLNDAVSIHNNTGSRTDTAALQMHNYSTYTATVEAQPIHEL